MNYTTIKGGFSEHRRIPRLGKIRLGLKVQKTKTDGSVVEYPTETKYFVVPPEVQDIYGEQPTELDVMLPSDRAEDVFPQSLSWFGRSKGLKCKGDMETAERLNEQTGAWEKRTCPCEHYKSDENPKGECTENGILITILPKVNMGGTYQIRTGSYHSVVDINSGLDYVRALIGRISMVPLKLRRVARDTHADGKKQTHYTLSLVMDANIDGVNQLRQDTSRILASAQLLLDAPEEENPKLDQADVIELDAEEIASMEDAQLAHVQAKLNQQRTLLLKPSEILAREEAKGSVHEPTAEEVVRDLQTASELNARQTATETASLFPAYREQISLSQSVSECSATLNTALKDETLSVFEVKQLQDEGKAKIVALRKK